MLCRKGCSWFPRRVVRLGLRAASLAGSAMGVIRGFRFFGAPWRPHPAGRHFVDGSAQSMTGIISKKQLLINRALRKLSSCRSIGGRRGRRCVGFLTALYNVLQTMKMRVVDLIGTSQAGWLELRRDFYRISSSSSFPALSHPLAFFPARGSGEFRGVLEEARPPPFPPAPFRVPFAHLA